jgi:hypothetical protein
MQAHRPTNTPRQLKNGKVEGGSEGLFLCLAAKKWEKRKGREHRPREKKERKKATRAHASTSAKH